MSKQIFMGRQKGSKNQVNKIAQAIEAQTLKPLFSERHSILARQIKGLFQFQPEPDDVFETKLRWFMIKDNIEYELMTYYWMTVFYREHPYMNIDYIKKELGIK